MENGTHEHKSRRGIYLLPNMFTTAGLFAGFYAIVAAMGGRFEAAAIAIFAAMIWRSEPAIGSSVISHVLRCCCNRQ